MVVPSSSGAASDSRQTHGLPQLRGVMVPRPEAIGLVDDLQRRLAGRRLPGVDAGTRTRVAREARTTLVLERMTGIEPA